MVWNPPMTLLLPFPTTHPHAITLLGVYLNSIQRITFTVHVHETIHRVGQMLDLGWD